LVCFIYPFQIPFIYTSTLQPSLDPFPAALEGRAQVKYNLLFTIGIPGCKPDEPVPTLLEYVTARPGIIHRATPATPEELATKTFPIVEPSRSRSFPLDADFNGFVASLL
jgi:hypothetical protein